MSVPWPRFMTMSIATVISLVSVAVAALGVGLALLAWREARRSATASESSVIEARRSADAAEASVREAGRSAAAAEAAARSSAVSADADRAADHRARAPRLDLALESPAEHDGTDAIYRVRNQGPTSLDSIVVHRPLTQHDVGRVVHPVAAVGDTTPMTPTSGRCPSPERSTSP
jgi:NAD-specific glutamate dehydrogenase